MQLVSGYYFICAAIQNMRMLFARYSVFAILFDNGPYHRHILLKQNAQIEYCVCVPL